MKLRPLQGQVLIRMDPQEAVTDGGIIIPDKHQEKAQFGIVLKTGIWKQYNDGSLKPFPVKKGERVLVNKRAGRWLHGEKSRLKLVPMEFVLAVVTPDAA